MAYQSPKLDKEAFKEEFKKRSCKYLCLEYSYNEIILNFGLWFWILTFKFWI
jgi:hypothetical protein